MAYNYLWVTTHVVDTYTIMGVYRILLGSDGLPAPGASWVNLVDTETGQWIGGGGYWKGMSQNPVDGHIWVGGNASDTGNYDPSIYIFNPTIAKWSRFIGGLEYSWQMAFSPVTNDLFVNYNATPNQIRVFTYPGMSYSQYSTGVGFYPALTVDTNGLVIFNKLSDTSKMIISLPTNAGGDDSTSEITTPSDIDFLAAGASGDVWGLGPTSELVKRTGGTGNFASVETVPQLTETHGMAYSSVYDKLYIAGYMASAGPGLMIKVKDLGTGDYTTLSGSDIPRGTVRFATYDTIYVSSHSSELPDELYTPPAEHTDSTYAQFDTGGAWRVRRWEKNSEVLTLKLEEPKARLKVKIPTSLFQRDSYPNIAEDKIGEPIPIAYGQIYGASPVCIDPSLRKFQVASHAINAFDGVQVYDSTTEAWSSVSFATTDLANGQFTLSSDDWDGKQQVSVDFRGKEISAGVLMTNAADIVEDILSTYCGIPAADIDTSGSFAEANARLEIGDDRYEKQANHRALSIYLDEQVEATELLENINACIGSYVFCDHDGLFRFKVFQPEPGNGATVELDETSIFSFEEEVESQDVISQTRGKYRERKARKVWDSVVETDAKWQYLTGATAPITKELELPVSNEADANYVAQRTLRMEGVRRKIYKAKCSHIAYPLLPGGIVKVSYARDSIDAVMEVIERRITLPGMDVTLTLGTLHGMGDQVGFWTADSPTFPASMGGGSTAAWDDEWTTEQKAWARQNQGFWTSDEGYCDLTDEESYLPSVWF